MLDSVVKRAQIKVIQWSWILGCVLLAAGQVSAQEVDLRDAHKFKLVGVTAEPAVYLGRNALRVEFTPERSAGRPRIDYGDTPTFAIIPLDFRDGTIEVDVLGKLNGKGTKDARGFAGLAFRINADASRFESVYLRPANGLKENPGSPRDKRAVQYFAFPDWRFFRTRDEYPDGRYEAGADIGLDEWIRFRIEVDGTRTRAFVNDVLALTVSDLKLGPSGRGAIGLWVDIGTLAYFANLRVSPR